MAITAKRTYDMHDMTEREKKLFGELIENAANFEVFDPKNYIEAKGHGLDYSEELMWGGRHRYATPEQKEWIEATFEEFNYAEEADALKNGDYEGFRKEVEYYFAQFGDATSMPVVMRLPTVARVLPKDPGKSEYAFFKLPYDGEHDGYMFRVPLDAVRDVPQTATTVVKFPQGADVEIRHISNGSRHIPAEILGRIMLGDPEKYKKPVPAPVPVNEAGPIK